MPSKLFVLAIMGVLAGAGLQAGQARAEVTVIGNGLAAECSSAAKSMSMNVHVRAEALQICTLALDNEPLSLHEAAATFVNRGVLYLGARDYAHAIQDFDQALRMEPALPEAHANRGAALIGEGQDAAGVVELNRGLALNTTEPEKAYFNRAVAEERLGDVRAAYFDYRRALELKPDWTLPKDELTRFHVVQK